MTVLQGLGFSFGDKTVSPSDYGDDYLAEFCRVLETYAPSRVTAVLEWGSGLTTQVIAHYVDNVWKSELFLTIDSFKEYQDGIFKDRSRSKAIVLRTVDITGTTRNQRDPELAFSTAPLAYGRKFDVIFIDGRRRMECAFVAAIVANPDALVVLHDYRRRRYQAIHALYDVVEDGSQFRVMRLRAEVAGCLSQRWETVSSLFAGKAA